MNELKPDYREASLAWYEATIRVDVLAESEEDAKNIGYQLCGSNTISVSIKKQKEGE